MFLSHPFIFYDYVDIRTTSFYHYQMGNKKPLAIAQSQAMNQWYALESCYGLHDMYMQESVYVCA